MQVFYTTMGPPYAAFASGGPMVFLRVLRVVSARELLREESPGRYSAMERTMAITRRISM